MSNGSERTPERCVHAPDGPDWAGLREPTSWKERAIAAEAQLDSMTVEWSAPDTDSIETTPFPFGYGTDEELARRSAAVLHGPVYKRLVSPWTAVEGDDQ